MRKYPLVLFIYLLLIFQTVFAQSSFEVDLKENKIHILYNGKERLNLGDVKFEGTTFKTQKATLKKKDNKMIVRFESGQKKSAEVEIESSGNVLSFLIDPHKNNSSDGQKFIGLFFNIPDFRIGTALFRYGESKAWTKPVAVRQISDLDSLYNQFFYWRYQDSLYAVAIPLGGDGYSASLGREGQGFGTKSFSLVDHYYQENIPLMAIAFGKEIYPLIDELMEKGMEKMGYLENLRKKKKYPEVFENFGWCTWDAFGHTVNEQKVEEGVKSFTKNNFPVPFVLIDDGWSKVGENMRLKALEPDSEKFSKGFKPLVEKLKKEYGVKNVGIWHTLNAYWKGIDTTSSLGRKYKNSLYGYMGKLPWSKEPLEKYFCPTPKNESGMSFFNDWYSYLSEQGISFVKVDDQLVVGQISNHQYPLWYTGQQLQKNFQIPAQKYFKGNVINCMEMTVDDIYHFRNSAIARASDDYMPKEITYNLESGNAAVHITNCLYNSLWLSPIVWPDFDMFESYQLYPEYHAIARAISAGPVYVSDWPGEQNFEVLWPLILHDGKVLRTDLPPRLTEDCLFQIQEARPLKAYSFSGGTGILGVWNTSNKAFVSGQFQPGELKGIQGDKFAVYEYFSQKLVEAERDQNIPLELTRMDYRLFSIVPIQEKAAVIGLLNKYISSKTVLNQKITSTSIDISLVEAGLLGVAIDRLPNKITANGVAVRKENYSYNKGLLKINLPLQLYPGKVNLRIER